MQRDSLTQGRDVFSDLGFVVSSRPIDRFDAHAAVVSNARYGRTAR